MYKIKVTSEYAKIVLLIMFIMMFGPLIVLQFQNFENLSTNAQCGSIIFLFVLIGDLAGIIYMVNSIKKYKWLAKNGVLIRNLPYKSFVDKTYIKARVIYHTTLEVEYKLQTGEKVILSRTWSEKLNLEGIKTVDILIDKNNPKKRYYIDFKIEEI